jgi:hypothetical protein
VGALGFAGCSRGLSAAERQRWNHALTYFIYAQADVQLSRVPFSKFPRGSESAARNWVVEGLHQPARLVSEQKIGAHIGFSSSITLGGDLERKYIDNPKAPFAETLAQLFRDARSTWDPRERFWHLPHEYHDDYESVRNDDRYHFFLAFYEDPFPGTTRD